MTFSISDLYTFSSINWDSFENRPSIDSSMPVCQEKDWYRGVACCMDGYTIEHVRDMAHAHGTTETAEAKFLDQYPCLNGLELDYFVDRLTRGTGTALD